MIKIFIALLLLCQTSEGADNAAFPYENLGVLALCTLAVGAGAASLFGVGRLGGALWGGGLCFIASVVALSSEGGRDTKFSRAIGSSVLGVAAGVVILQF